MLVGLTPSLRFQHVTRLDSLRTSATPIHSDWPKNGPVSQATPNQRHPRVAGSQQKRLFLAEVAKKEMCSGAVSNDSITYQQYKKFTQTNKQGQKGKLEGALKTSFKLLCLPQAAHLHCPGSFFFLKPVWAKFYYLQLEYTFVYVFSNLFNYSLSAC